MRFTIFFYIMLVSVQASTFLQIRVCVWSVTAIPWEHHSVVVRARAASVRVPIPLWEGDAVTSVVRCSLDSTPAWAGKPLKLSLILKQTNEIHICWLYIL